MRVSDLILLLKKIGVGILVTLIPLGILTGGLWVSQKVVNNHPQSNVSYSKEASSAH